VQSENKSENRSSPALFEIETLFSMGACTFEGQYTDFEDGVFAKRYIGIVFKYK
jgi:hypothetical protein